MIFQLLKEGRTVCYSLLDCGTYTLLTEIEIPSTVANSAVMSLLLICVYDNNIGSSSLAMAIPTPACSTFWSVR